MHLTRSGPQAAGEFVADFDRNLIDEADQGRVAQARHQTLHRRSVVGQAVGLPLSPARFGAIGTARLGQIEGETLGRARSDPGIVSASAHEAKPARPVRPGPGADLHLEEAAILARGPQHALQAGSVFRLHRGQRPGQGQRGRILDRHGEQARQDRREGDAVRMRIVRPGAEAGCSGEGDREVGLEGRHLGIPAKDGTRTATTRRPGLGDLFTRNLRFGPEWRKTQTSGKFFAAINVLGYPS